ncbi:MAG: serine/threonine protein kinase, partial [Clostridiales bacterium]|nr:serine/threonine protein kinase [Clostridiales bacterium]
QKAIPTVTVSADKNPSYSTNPGNATQDKVFCLSITEVNKYFKNDEARKCAPTQYAINNNAYTSGSYKVDGKATCYWWLRSPVNFGKYAAIVNLGGTVYSSGDGVNRSDNAVRPALYIDLNLIP